MSMLDAFFNKGFKGPKCKTLLKLTIPRIKLLRNKRVVQLKQMRRDIAKLLENGQEATARIRVEHIIREENMMAAQEILELFCELIAVRLPIIETQRECPLDLKEAISSICFAALRCSDLPELQQVQMLFAAKYGKEFIAAATELMPDCGVNRQIIELLSVRAPSAEAKLKLLKEIAEEHELDWDPADSETEFLKPREDLLNGPRSNHFISAPTLPLYEGKDGESSIPAKQSDEESDTDADLHSLDLPEVPRVSVRAPSESPPDRDIVPPHPDHQFTKSSPPSVDASHVPSVESELDSSDLSLPYLYSPHNASKIPQNISETDIDLHSVPSVLPSRNKGEVSMDSPSVPFVSFSAKHTVPVSSIQQSKSDFSVDFQDVLAAANAAAETAERAAATARAAASLAEVRISELVMKRNNMSPDGREHGIRTEHSKQVDSLEGTVFDHQNSFGHINEIRDNESAQSSNSWTLSSDDVLKMVAKAPGLHEQVPRHWPAHQPQRSTSLEDDTIYSYPNLFTSKDSSLKSNSHSFSDNSP